MVTSGCCVPLLPGAGCSGSALVTDSSQTALMLQEQPSVLPQGHGARGRPRWADELSVCVCACVHMEMFFSLVGRLPWAKILFFL